MKKAFLMIVTILLVNNLIGQSIGLKQKKSSSDVKVVNGDYELYFKKADLLAGISIIDETFHTDNKNIINSIKSNKIRIVDLGSTANTDFVTLLKNNLGAYLLKKGQVAIYKKTQQILKIVADIGPTQAELDGSRIAPVFFSEEGSEKEIFLGNLNAKL